MLLAQRNKYICFMAIFTSLSLNVYISVLKYLYQKRDHFELKKSMIEARTSGGDPRRTSQSTDARIST